MSLTVYVYVGTQEHSFRDVEEVRWEDTHVKVIQGQKYSAFPLHAFHYIGVSPKTEQ